MVHSHSRGVGSHVSISTNSKKKSKGWCGVSSGILDFRHRGDSTNVYRVVIAFVDGKDDMNNTRNYWIKLAHVHPRRLGWNDDTRRGIMQQRYGVESTAKLPLDKLRDWVSYLYHQVQKIPTKSESDFAAKQKQIAKIHAQCKAMNLPLSYANTIAKNQHGIDYLEWLSPAQLRGVIAALAYHQQRRKRK